MAKSSSKSSKKRKVIVESTGEAHITASFNNIIISLTNKNGDVISWSSAGKMSFRGSKKNTPYAAQLASEDCAKVAHEAGLRKVKVYVKGPGNGRESAIRSIHNSGIEVTEMITITDDHNHIKTVIGKSLEKASLVPKGKGLGGRNHANPKAPCLKRESIPHLRGYR